MWVEAWTAAVRRGGAIRWVLEEVEGVVPFVEGIEPTIAGLVALDRAVEVCFERPDWQAQRRLFHPSLSLPGSASIEWVADPPQAAVLSGAVDAIQHVGDPDALAPGLEALPLGTRRWMLALHPERTWLRDPALRRWLRGALSQEDDWSLALPGAQGVTPAYRDEVSARRPLSDKARPRLQLMVQPVGESATQLGQRLVAVLERHRIDVRLVAWDQGRLQDGQFDLVALAVAASADLLELEASFRQLGPTFGPQVDRLRGLDRMEPRDPRREEAQRAWERELEQDAIWFGLLERRLFVAMRSERAVDWPLDQERKWRFDEEFCARFAPGGRR